mmetsp:Transcript_30284/g.64913  ORF Transcript_30284/g.64913 Transcript_30284/m.64913 type:complete len:226 (+) Transcript_30284:243-920(+)
MPPSEFPSWSRDFSRQISRPSSTRSSYNPICKILYVKLGNSSDTIFSACRFNPLNSPNGVSNSPNASGLVETRMNCVGPFFSLGFKPIPPPRPPLPTPTPTASLSFHLLSPTSPTKPSKEFLNPSISTLPFVGLATARNKNAAFKLAIALGRFPSKSVAQKITASTPSVIVLTCTGSSNSTSTILNLFKLYPSMTRGSYRKEAFRSSSLDQAGPREPMPSSAPTS